MLDKQKVGVGEEGVSAIWDCVKDGDALDDTHLDTVGEIVDVTDTETLYDPVIDELSVDEDSGGNSDI